MDSIGKLIVFAFIAWVALSVLYLLIKAAVRDGVKAAFEDMKIKDEDDVQ